MQSVCLSSLLFLATEEVVTKSVQTFEKEIQKIKNDIVKGTGIPAWGLVAILIGNKAYAFREGDF